MRRIMSMAVLFCLPPVLLIVIFPDNANAIPAFARKYQTSCMLCHAPFPKLTAMGESFRLNGYKLPDADEIYVKEQPVSMGAEAYKKVFPKAVWPSSIPGVPPISIRATGNVAYHPYGPQDGNSDFNFPSEVTLLGAGSFENDFAFFAQIGFEIEDDTTTTTPMAWLMWQNLFSGVIGEHHLDLKAGNVGRHAIALPNARNENNITLEDYLYATELDLDNQPGFQVVGYGRHWRYGAGVVESDRKNTNKDFYTAFSIKFGGLGYDGSGQTSAAGGVGTSPAGYWLDNSVQLGFFAYEGYVEENADRFDRIGGDARITYQSLSVAGGYITGNNRQANEDKHIWFGEAQYFVFPWLIPYIRYEDMTVKNVDNADLARFIVGSAMLVRANIRVNLEGRIYTTDQPTVAADGETKDDDQIAFLIDWAF